MSWNRASFSCRAQTTRCCPCFPRNFGSHAACQQARCGASPGSMMQRPSPKPQGTSSLTPGTFLPPQMAQQSSASSDGGRLVSVVTRPEPDGAGPRPLRGGSTPPLDTRLSRASLASRSIALPAGTGVIKSMSSSISVTPDKSAEMALSSATTRLLFGNSMICLWLGLGLGLGVGLGFGLRVANRRDDAAGLLGVIYADLLSATYSLPQQVACCRTAGEVIAQSDRPKLTR